MRLNSPHAQLTYLTLFGDTQSQIHSAIHISTLKFSASKPNPITIQILTFNF